MIYFPDPYTHPLHIANIPSFLNSGEIKQVATQLKTLSYDKATTVNKDSTVNRRSQVKWLPFSSEWDWIYSKLTTEIHLLNNQYWNFNLKPSIERIQYTEYSSKYKGYYNWHSDIGPNATSHRKISITIQLSNPTDYEGGKLEIINPFIDKNNKTRIVQSSPREIGNATIFPSYLIHRVTPVTKGIRRSLVLWVGGAPFR